MEYLGFTGTLQLSTYIGISFLFMMMLDTFYFIEFREKFVILFIAVSFACIILTAVRSVLIASIIVIGYIFYRVFSRKQFIKFILYCFYYLFVYI